MNRGRSIWLAAPCSGHRFVLPAHAARAPFGAGFRRPPERRRDGPRAERRRSRLTGERRASDPSAKSALPRRTERRGPGARSSESDGVARARYVFPERPRRALVFRRGRRVALRREPARRRAPALRNQGAFGEARLAAAAPAPEAERYPRPTRQPMATRSSGSPAHRRPDWSRGWRGRSRGRLMARAVAGYTSRAVRLGRTLATRRFFAPRRSRRRRGAPFARGRPRSSRVHPARSERRPDAPRDHARRSHGRQHADRAVPAPGERNERAEVATGLVDAGQRRCELSHRPDTSRPTWSYDEPFVPAVTPFNASTRTTRWTNAGSSSLPPPSRRMDVGGTPL
jgi:hypothetical protein